MARKPCYGHALIVFLICFCFLNFCINPMCCMHVCVRVRLFVRGTMQGMNARWVGSLPNCKYCGQEEAFSQRPWVDINGVHACMYTLISECHHSPAPSQWVGLEGPLGSRGVTGLGNSPCLVYHGHVGTWG